METFKTLKAVSIMVATSSFGCWIDIPDVCVVYHVRVPYNIIRYLEQSGTVVRDVKPTLSKVQVVERNNSE